MSVEIGGGVHLVLRGSMPSIEPLSSDEKATTPLWLHRDPMQYAECHTSPNSECCQQVAEVLVVPGLWVIPKLYFKPFALVYLLNSTYLYQAIQKVIIYKL